LTFAAVWRIFPGHSIVAGSGRWCGGAVGGRLGSLASRRSSPAFKTPVDVLIFLLWNPPLIFEVFHSGAMWTRSAFTTDRRAFVVGWKAPPCVQAFCCEIGIGFDWPATLVKVKIPLILLPALWSVQRATRRDWLYSLAPCCGGTGHSLNRIGYALYIAPGVDGFLLTIAALQHCAARAVDPSGLEVASSPGAICRRFAICRL
jgi:hypothetical protein